MTVTLRGITGENVTSVLALRLAPGQERFVSTVADSLAEAEANPHGNPWRRAVHAGDAPVGFVVLSCDVEPQPPDAGRSRGRPPPLYARVVADPDAVPALAPGAPPPPEGSDVVDWITRSTRRDRTVLSAVPPGYARYATVAVPDDDGAKTRADAALVEVLAAQTPGQPWWLGYLDTGVADVVDPQAPRVAVYVGWPYVLRQGGPDQALTSRTNAESTPWHSALPELLFPADRSWVVSTLWDDDWRCVGGPAALVDALLARPELTARTVRPDEDTAPPGQDAG